MKNSKTKNNKKLQWEKPVLESFESVEPIECACDGTGSAAGSCNPSGGSASGRCVSTGSSASGRCISAGGSAGGKCEVGGAAR